ncbi:MAG: GAF domain-containing protein, partial [Anaerolineales bacterium]|nr:GAF domain-containing protein [Anaerolineales bacterium]
FERMPMGIAVLDRNYRIQRYNPTWNDFSKRYAPPNGVPLAPGVCYFDHLPASDASILPMFERTLAGETIQQSEVRLESGGIVTYWDVVLAPLVEEKEIVGILAVSTDATERVMLQQNLEERVDERTQEIERRRVVAESLREIIGMINSNISIDEFLEKAVTMAAERLGAAACTLHRIDLEKGEVAHVASYGLEGIYTKGSVRSFRYLKASGAEKYIEATAQRQPTYTNYPPLPERVDEIRRDASIPEAIKKERIILRERFAGSFSAPLFIQERLFGGLVFYYSEPQEFSTEQIQLGLTFAEQVAVAIENERLHQAEQDRQRELQLLLEVASTANRSLDLDEMLRQTLDLLVDATEASRTGVILLDEASGEWLPHTIRPSREIESGDLAEMIGACQVVVDRGESLYVVPDPDKGLLEPGSLVPLQIRGRILGVLAIIGPQGSRFTTGQLVLFKSIADQLSVAIENARLFEKAEEAAIAAERNRLARDLHDAVTQTLFSASLIADVLPKIWEKKPVEGHKRLEELRQLTRGALSEMRTLLLELRPTALVDTDLGDLIGHQVNAFSARTRLPISYQRHCEGNPPPEIKEMCYRITQEAFNNIAKHADAGQVGVKLDCNAEQVELVIQDDGNGFELEEGMTEGLGLGIMQERARNLGAQLEIYSQIHEGTRLRIIWQRANDKESKDE